MEDLYIPGPHCEESKEGACFVQVVPNLKSQTPVTRCLDPSKPYFNQSRKHEVS